MIISVEDLALLRNHDYTKLTQMKAPRFKFLRFSCWKSM